MWNMAMLVHPGNQKIKMLIMNTAYIPHRDYVLQLEVLCGVTLKTKFMFTFLRKCIVRILKAL